MNIRKIVNIIREMRPAHWVKNLLVVAPVFFSAGLIHPRMLLDEFAAFCIFCLLAGHVYIVNDLMDIEADGRSGIRRGRPYAAGLVSRQEMRVAGAATGLAAVVAAVFLGPSFCGACAGYMALMHLYTLVLKKTVILGAAAISAGMIIRIFAGASAINVEVSGWVYPIVLFAAFYVALGKKIFNEEKKEGDAAGAEENTAKQISISGIKIVYYLSGAAACIVYLLYSLSDVGMVKYGTKYLWVTAPFVFAAVIRYNTVAAANRNRKDHLEAVLTDAFLIAMLILWIAVFAFLIYA